MSGTPCPMPCVLHPTIPQSQVNTTVMREAILQFIEEDLESGAAKQPGP